MRPENIRSVHFKDWPEYSPFSTMFTRTSFGGQPGRDRKLREPLPPERVDETIDTKLTQGR